MKTIFIAGSRNIRHLNQEIKSRINNIIKSNFKIVVGDANGADKAVQKYLVDAEYKNVVVYCSGLSCRNNIGTWKTHHVYVDGSYSGRDFYTQKDIEMAQDADFGFMIWDNKSKGTFNNILELTKQHKKVVVYSILKNNFCNIKSSNDLKLVTEDINYR